MPTLPGVGIAPPASLGRRASGADFGALEAEARGQRAQVIQQGVGQLVEVGAQIKQAADEMRLGRRAAELSAQIQRAQFDLEQDPNIETHEERFQKSTADLLKNAREGLDPGIAQRLEDRVFPSLAHAKLEVSAGVRKRRLENADADRAEMLRLNADQTAQTFDPVRRAQIRGQTVGTLDQALKAGLIDQAHYDASVRAFDRSVSEADIRRLIREDPAQAFRRLGDAADPLHAGRSQAEVEQWRAQAMSEQQQQMREEHEKVRWAQSQADRAEKNASDAAQKDLDDLWAKKDVPGMQAVLRQKRAVLSPEAYEHYVGLMSGTVGAPKTVPGVYINLSERAARGEPIGDFAIAAYRSGTLDQDDLERVKRLSEERRFGTVAAWLAGNTKQGLYDFDPNREKIGAEIQREFSVFTRENPNATADQAQEFGSKLLRAAKIKEIGQLVRVNDPRDPGGQVDVNVLIQQTLDRAARGELSPEALGTELKRLKALDEAQQGAAQGAQK